MRGASDIIDQLVCQGVSAFCIAPGSRSAPLALAAAEHPKAEAIVHFDERGLAFYALGLSKAMKKPAALIVTSGTALGNLFPAVMEAYHSHTPLILLTADRPHELRDCGSNQTTDQVKLFSNVVYWEQDLSPHLETPHLRSIVAQAVFQSLFFKGPVHLNCPFQEPLHAPPLFSYGSPIHFSFPSMIAPPMISEAKRGIILLGPLDDPAPVLQLAKKVQWPVFADLLSNARQTPSEEQIVHFEELTYAVDMKPDLLLHIGGRFISKQIHQWMEKTPLVHVSPYPDLQDPARRVSARILSDIEPFCKSFEAKTDPSWLKMWQTMDAKVQERRSQIWRSPFTEAHAVASLPRNRPIFFANSMPIRHADRFFTGKACPKIFANRGLAGIDGNIATACGIARALKEPLIAFLGDQTTLHDLTSFPFIQKDKILLIISNNFGGAIFDSLPISQSPHLDTLFAAKHGWTFEHIAKMFEIPYYKREGALSDLPEWGVLELMTDRAKNKHFLSSLKEETQTLPEIKMFSTTRSEASLEDAESTEKENK